MTEDKRKKIELCFDSLEKIVSLRKTLDSSLGLVSLRLEWAIDILKESQLPDESEPFDTTLRDGFFRLPESVIDYINEQYAEALWGTMEQLLPHYKSLPNFKSQK